jgi:hypothetical protein
MVVCKAFAFRAPVKESLLLLFIVVSSHFFLSYICLSRAGKKTIQQHKNADQCFVTFCHEPKVALSARRRLFLTLSKVVNVEYNPSRKQKKTATTTTRHDMRLDQ